jgi:hypothetical protein
VVGGVAFGEINFSNCAFTTTSGTGGYLNLNKLVFDGCNSLSLIKDESFFDCANLTEIEIKNCTALVNISDGTAPERRGSFEKCTKLSGVTITNCSQLNRIGPTSTTPAADPFKEDHITSFSLQTCPNFKLIRGDNSEETTQINLATNGGFLAPAS